MNISFTNPFPTNQGIKASKTQCVTACERIRNTIINNEGQQKRVFNRTLDSDS